MNDPENNGGTDQDPPTPHPPVNRAITCLRVFLWILPAGVAVLTAMGVSSFNFAGFAFRPGLGSWLAINILFVAGAGWYDANLSKRGLSESDGVFYRVVLFFFLQLFLIPLLPMTVLFLICFFNPIKF